MPPRKAYHEGLGPSQLQAYASLINNNSIFLTGSAGTGKSELLKRVTEYWTDNHHPYALTASTGIAAVNIGGRTFHSFFWLRPDDEDLTVEEVYARLSKMAAFRNYSAKKIETLIVDEVSMLSPKIIALASNLMKVVRRNGAPFGGIQVVLVGDFFQLPPVQKGKTPVFLFECPIFYECVQDRIILKETWRQKDPVFIDLLTRMRLGSLNKSDIELLKSRVNADITKFGIEPTELWATNKDVDRLNLDKLSQIKTPSITFQYYSGYKGNPETGTRELEKFVKEHDFKPLDLKGPNDDQTGAQVMLTYNLNTERGLVNGSRGVILGFQKPTTGYNKDFFERYDEPEVQKAYLRTIEHPMVRFYCNGTPLEIVVPFVRYTKHVGTKDFAATLYTWQMPLKLAWATTVHKSQGQTLDCLKVSLDKSVFADGQAYVAVSRARSLEGLTLKEFDPDVVKANASVGRFYSSDFSKSFLDPKDIEDDEEMS